MDTGDLFTHPNAARVPGGPARPERLDDIVGQDHLVGPDGILTRFLKRRWLPNLILYGPPGVGKTSIARILCRTMGGESVFLSATRDGAAAIRDAGDTAQKVFRINGSATTLFVDEVHRLSRPQIEVLLPLLEHNNSMRFIGATTENPSFSLPGAVLSRCDVLFLHPLRSGDLRLLAERLLHSVGASIDERLVDSLVLNARGDARRIHRGVELIQRLEGEPVDGIVCTLAALGPGGATGYDDEERYALLSWYQKSIRGGEASAAMLALAMMCAGGEDPRVIARRLVVTAAEDIGLADPNAFLVASAAMSSVEKVGPPESDIVLAFATAACARAPASNTAYQALRAAQARVQANPIQVPTAMRNASTDGLGRGFGASYRTPHQDTSAMASSDYYPGGVVVDLFGG